MESKKERGIESRKKKKESLEQEEIWNGFSKKKKNWLMSMHQSEILYIVTRFNSKFSPKLAS